MGCQCNADAEEAVQQGTGNANGEGDNSVQGTKEWGDGQCQGLEPG